MKTVSLQHHEFLTRANRDRSKREEAGSTGTAAYVDHDRRRRKKGWQKMRVAISVLR